jgi:malonyl-CoA decarboxylase
LSAEAAKVAVFYSISNCQKGLGGISFGNLLIKQVVAELAVEYPALTHFVTLSPIPRLNAWLQTQLDHETHGAAARAVLDGTAAPDDLRGLAARYLLTAKRADGKPLDPVARFHLGNGAEVHEVHAGADQSPNGRAQSSGAMVNYLYDLPRTEAHHKAYAFEHKVAASKSVHARAAAPLKHLPKETTP